MSFAHWKIINKYAIWLERKKVVNVSFKKPITRSLKYWLSKFKNYYILYIRALFSSRPKD